jgi:outer membrane protein TolC
LTLPEALAFARTHQPSLQAAIARVQAAQADAQVPRAQWLPSVGAMAQVLEGTTNNTTASYYSVSGVPIPRIGATSVGSRDWAPSPSTLAALGASQEIYDFGRIGAQSALADAAIAVGTQQARSERLRLDLMVKDAYFAVVSAKAVLRAANDAFARAQLHRDMAKAEVQSGLFAPVELTRSEAELTRFEVARVRASGSVQSAQLVFAAVVGVPDAALDAGGENPAMVPPPPLPEAVRELAERDPTILEADARVNQQVANTKAVAALSRPELLATGSVSGRAGGAAGSNGKTVEGDGWIPDVPNWNVGLVLRWPLYDPVVAARSSASAKREVATRADRDAVFQQELAAIRAAYVALDVANATLVSLGKAAAAAAANYQQAEARFKAGLGNAVELADAEALRTEAEIQAAVGEFQAHRARALVARLIAEES